MPARRLVNPKEGQFGNLHGGAARLFSGTGTQKRKGLHSCFPGTTIPRLSGITSPGWQKRPSSQSQTAWQRFTENEVFFIAIEPAAAFDKLDEVDRRIDPAQPVGRLAAE